MTFEKTSSQNQNHDSFFFRRVVIFDKLSKLGQISCVILCYKEIKDFLYLGKIFAWSSILDVW